MTTFLRIQEEILHVKIGGSVSNPNGSHFANDANANPFGVNFYENASFMRIKDVSLSYEVPAEALRRLNINSCKFYLTGSKFSNDQ